MNITIFNITNLFVISLFLVLNIIFIKLLVGIEKDRNRYKFDAILTIIIITLSYYILIYVIGIFIGFLKSGYSISNLFQNILPLLLLIVVTEFFRYCINRKSEKNYLLLSLSVIIFILIDISIGIYAYELKTANDIVELIILVIFPSITKNILLTYVTLKFGYKPSILYRVLMETSVYFLPLFPNFGEYISLIITFIFPVIVFVILIRINKLKKNTESSRTNKTLSKITSIFLGIFIILIVYLNSGFFKYFSLSIGSGSMKSEFDVGDVVIVKRSNEYEEFEIGEILVYKKDNIVIVHRISDISYNGKYYFKTKGDNNENIDNWLVSEDDVLGIAMFKIKYVGLPVVWLNNLIK